VENQENQPRSQLIKPSSASFGSEAIRAQTHGSTQVSSLFFGRDVSTAAWRHLYGLAKQSYEAMFRLSIFTKPPRLLVYEPFRAHLAAPMQGRSWKMTLQGRLQFW